MQRHQFGVVPARDVAALADRGRDLSRSRQEAQNVAPAFAATRRQRGRDRFSGRVLDRERMQRPWDIDHRAVAEERGHRARIECGRHDDDAEIGARQPGLLDEREAEIGVHAALVKFIDDRPSRRRSAADPAAGRR